MRVLKFLANSLFQKGFLQFTKKPNNFISEVTDPFKRLATLKTSTVEEPQINKNNLSLEELIRKPIQFYKFYPSKTFTQSNAYRYSTSQRYDEEKQSDNIKLKNFDGKDNINSKELQRKLQAQLAKKEVSYPHEFEKEQLFKAKEKQNQKSQDKYIWHNLQQIDKIQNKSNVKLSNLINHKGPNFYSQHKESSFNGLALKQNYGFCSSNAKKNKNKESQSSQYDIDYKIFENYEAFKRDPKLLKLFQQYISKPERIQNRENLLVHLSIVIGGFIRIGRTKRGIQRYQNQLKKNFKASNIQRLSVIKTQFPQIFKSILNIFLEDFIYKIEINGQNRRFIYTITQQQLIQICKIILRFLEKHRRVFQENLRQGKNKKGSQDQLLNTQIALIVKEISHLLF